MKIRRSRLVLLTMLALLVMIVSACANSNGDKEGSGSSASPNPSASPSPEVKEPKQWSKAPDMAIDPDKSYEAEFDTSKGKFTVQLFAKEAPKTVNNFVFLSKEGFYDDVIFHRIVKTFMIQTGDPLGNGMGGPGYKIEDELNSPYKYDPGIVAMAKTREPNSGGSQFFICTGDDCGRNLNSNPNYTIFGKIIEGMDNVQKIAEIPVTMNPNSGESSLPTEEVKINTITIKEK
ncbi:peptidylprolyl isomerase [Paenibacillus eucommiae]|uniref:Peptidyl-prolyl cis-trans isomerase n=1 Tax=Paenibacillus eucommiae TaxID=1355755 RepID=A0ABS4J5S6_9BACL|nr:peptidylprolyl isomerase [Paenibacillus eucommiae]MBP1995196.1 cyclophilin family peptidyl-prolyl cis-trans isomerase [Paenibacillus eucommiae]